MKTLYRQFISATLIILTLSIGIGLVLTNLVYVVYTKGEIDKHNVKTLQTVVNVLEHMHAGEAAFSQYLESVGRLGYQLYVVSEDGEEYYFGERFDQNGLSRNITNQVLAGDIYHGQTDTFSSVTMMGHFSNRIENTVGKSFVVNGKTYALFLKPNSQLLFSDIHMVLAGFVLAIAIVSLIGVIFMARRLIKPITELTTAIQAVSNENFNNDLNIERQDEIGQLAESFLTMQQQLKHNDEARKAFIGNVSHDFQSPLMNIQGYTDLLRGSDLSEEERLHYAEIVSDESKRLSNLTKQLLLMTSLDQVNYPLQLTRVRVDLQIKEIIQKYQWRLNERGIEISYKLGPIEVVTDEELLLNVWDNLLSNAIKYNRNHGDIVISCHQQDEFLLVSISDTGIGLRAESMQHIFERFYRVDEARKKDGTGLGLAIVQQILTLLSGEITVESTFGKGSCFTVKLPMKK